MVGFLILLELQIREHVMLLGVPLKFFNGLSLEINK